jgi:hypothetical protein
VPFAVETEVFSDMEASVTWSLIDTPDAVNARYKPVGSAMWDTLLDVTQPLLLTDLAGCTDYEIEFESVCADTSTGFQANHQFSTLGCCEVPTGLSVIAGESTATLSWNDVFAADFYVIQWRPQGDTVWIEEATPDNTYTLENLEGCTYYEARLQADCDTTETGYSEIIPFRTKGCGNCIDLSYCASAADDATDEYIDSLIIGPLVSPSGQNGGYIFYEDLNPEFRAGDDYSLWIRPGFSGQSFDEKFRIWLDANQDGTFGEDELLLDTLLLQADVILSQQLTIPASALEGSTRMRVSMAFSNPFFPISQDPCGSIDFGEVEDYCVTILRNPDPCPPVDTVQFDGITFTGAFMFWPSAYGAIAYTFRYREVGTTEYEELATIDTTANLEGFEKCKMYEVQIRTICLFDTTSYNVNYIFETDCDVAVQEINPLLTSFVVYPNPVHDVVSLRFQPVTTGDHSISLYNMQGQRIQHKILYAESNEASELRFDDLNTYPPGLYFAVIEKDGLRATKKIVKM